jgi:hypothetical protein
MELSDIDDRSPDVSSHSWILWIYLALWVLSALLININWVDLSDALFLLAGLIPLALWAAFGVLAIFALVRCIVATAHRVSRGPRLRTYLFFLALASAGTINYLHGPAIGLSIRFHMLKSTYERAVASIEAGKVPDTDLRVLVDKGPPIRVAFPWPGGILDNWSGVVYDPSGLVRKAMMLRKDLSNLHDPAFRDVTGLFGGDLCYCKSLGGNWYFCGFT